MKKIKLITTLSSLTAIATATPIIATSCSNSTSKGIQLAAQGLNNKVAKGGSINAQLSLTLDGELQTLKSISASSTNNDLPVTFTVDQTDVVYNQVANLTIDATSTKLAIGDTATINYELVDVFGNKVTKAINVEVVDDDFALSKIVTFGKAHYGDATPDFNACFNITNAGNNVQETDFPPSYFIEKVYDSENNDVTSDFSISGYGPGSGATCKPTTPYSFPVKPAAGKNPEYGKYTLVFTARKSTSGGTETIGEQTIKFELENGFNFDSAAISNAVYDKETATLAVNSLANVDAVATFELAFAESPYHTEMAEYSFAKTPIEGISIEKNTGIITISKDIIQTVLTQVTVVAKIDGKVKAELPLTILSKQLAS